MGSYERTNVFRKIDSLEDKVNRLEEIIQYGNKGDYSSPYYEEGQPPHYRSAIRLSKATQNFKQDLLENPRHDKLSRENYEEIYDRVSLLERELNKIVRNMSFDRSQRSDYSYYSNGKSQSYYDDSYSRGYKSQPRRRIVHEPRRKRVSYDSYVELIPSDSSCSSESVEEIIYYIEPSTTSSSSSSSVIVEEYVPKRFTRKPVRNKDLYFDVSKSRPRESVEKPPPPKIKPKTRRKRLPPPEISVTKQPKDTKSKKEKKRDKEVKSDSGSKSEIFLVKKSPTDASKTKEKNEKYFVSRLKKVESPDTGENFSDEEEDENSKKKRKSNFKINFQLEKRSSKSHKKHEKENEEKPSNHQPEKPSNVMNEKLKKTGKKARSASRKTAKGKRVKDKTKRLSPKKLKNEVQVARGSIFSQLKNEVQVARGSIFSHDPFVRSINYDDYVLIGQDNKSDYSTNNENSDYCNKSDLVGGGNESLSKINTASVYEMSNSIYSFDPYLKKKEKIYPKEEPGDRELSHYSNNISHGKNGSRIHNENKNDIVLNEDEPYQDKLTVKQTPRDFKRSSSKDLKEKCELMDKKSVRFNEDTNSVKIPCPVAHSVYLTTVPIYRTDIQDTHDLPVSPVIQAEEKSTRTHREKENDSVDSEIPSHNKSLIEDEIIMNVAKKLSPVVAEMIHSQYLKKTDNYKTRSEYSISNPNVDHHNDIRVFGGNSTKSNVNYNINSDNENFSTRMEDQSQGKIHYESSRSGNEGMVELANPSQRVTLTQVYVSTMEDDSPLQQKPSNTKKSKAKSKMKAISSMSRIFSKGSKSKISKPASEVPSTEDVIQRRESSAQLQRGSQVQQRASQKSLKQQMNRRQSRSSHINKKSRGSKISQIQQGSTGKQKQKSGSVVGQQKAPTPKITVTGPDSLSSDGGMLEQLVSLHNVPSKTSSRAQSTRTPSLTSQAVKKKPSRLKSIMKRVKSQDKVQKKKEPSLVSILHRMRSSDRRSKVLKQEPQQQVDEETRKRVASALNLEKQASLANTTFLGQSQSQVTPPGAVGAPYDHEPMNRIDVDGKRDSSDSHYSGSREYLKNIRSVSKYYDENENMEAGFKEGKESSGIYGVGLPDTQEVIVKKDSYFTEVNPEINQPGQEETLARDSEKSRNTRELHERLYSPPYKPMKRFEFCIHYAKEKRTQFESQSIVSLDHILASQSKKIYSSEDVSLSEYAYDQNTETYRHRKILPKQPEKCQRCKRQDSNSCYNYSSKGVYSKSNCCKNGMFTKSEELISDSCTTVDWHKVANEIKRT